MLRATGGGFLSVFANRPSELRRWLRPFVALLLVVGIALSPLRAVAATVPMLLACRAPAPRTATVRVEARSALRLELSGAFEYVYDDAPRGHDGGTKRQAFDETGAVDAYDPALEFTERREVSEGIYEAPAPTTAAEGLEATAASGENLVVNGRNYSIRRASSNVPPLSRGRITTFPAPSTR